MSVFERFDASAEVLHMEAVARTRPDHQHRVRRVGGTVWCAWQAPELSLSKATVASLRAALELWDSAARRHDRFDESAAGERCVEAIRSVLGPEAREP